jgi:hypothetical protein
MEGIAARTPPIAAVVPCSNNAHDVIVVAGNRIRLLITPDAIRSSKLQLHVLNGTGLLERLYLQSMITCLIIFFASVIKERDITAISEVNISMAIMPRLRR